MLISPANRRKTDRLGAVNGAPRVEARISGLGVNGPHSTHFGGIPGHYYAISFGFLSFLAREPGRLVVTKPNRQGRVRSHPPLACIQPHTSLSCSHIFAADPPYRQLLSTLRASNLQDYWISNLTTAKKILAGGLTEREAIDRAQQGDAESFEALYSLHKRRVYSLCLRMIGNIAEAEDLTQEAFLQVYRKIATFRGESAFSTWLHRLTVNVVLMHLRKKVLPEVSLEETLEPKQEDGPKKDVGVCDNVLAGSIDRVNLERSIESLPPGYRIMFVLHDVEGYEHKEIAEMIGCSIGNSKSQLHKARMKMRELLKMSKAERDAKR